MDQWKGRVALVTGASAGIGYDLSKQLAENFGMNVIGCARNIKQIEILSKELSKIKNTGILVPVKCDVTKEEEVIKAFGIAHVKFGGIDVCINNAGLAHDAPLLSGRTSDWKEMLDVNVLGVCICTREFMKQIKEREVKQGHIIIMNSMSGHRLVSSTNNTYFYGATKFAVTALTEGIRRELRSMESPIKVTSVSPGLVRTEFLGRLTKTKPEKMEASKQKYGEVGVMEAEDVTAAVIFALSTPPRMEIHDILVRPTHQVA